MGAQIIAFEGRQKHHAAHVRGAAGPVAATEPSLTPSVAGTASAAALATATTPERFEFWRGASGRDYVHSVYDLFTCPDVLTANYVLVRRNADGSRSALRIGRTEHTSGSVNLATIRHRAAHLGANEVHVHYLASRDADRDLIAFDLRAAHYATLGAEHPSLSRSA
ncbi:MAG: hypothetical protein AAFR04_09830 [Pseudomonadota bacterium]